MKVDRHIWHAQKGNWVWIHTGSKKFAGQIEEVIKGDYLDSNEYVVKLKDGSRIRALQRELKRCRQPKRTRNADWFQKC